MKSRSKNLKIDMLVVSLLVVATGFLLLNKKSPWQNPSKNPGQDLTKSVQQDKKPRDSTNDLDKKKYSNNAGESIWVIVNKSRPLNPVTFAPNDLVDVGNGQFMRQNAATALQEMIAAAKKNGLSLQPLSGYRSYQTQQTVYANEVSRYGQETADRQSAKPGHSEHQTGLSIDLGGGGCGIEDCFGNTAEGKWVAKNAYMYGYIIRYPEGKEDITGYRYEPWHIRYVGKELAAEMQRSKTITLEEFFDL